MGPTENGGQGRAQLVAQRGQELILGPARSLGFTARRAFRVHAVTNGLLSPRLFGELLTNLVLPVAGPQAGSNQGDERGGSNRSFYDADIPQAGDDFPERGRFATGSRQNDHWQVGPDWLSGNTREQSVSIRGNGLLRNDQSPGALGERFAELRHGPAHRMVDLVCRKQLADRKTIGPR